MPYGRKTRRPRPLTFLLILATGVRQTLSDATDEVPSLNGMVSEVKIATVPPSEGSGPLSRQARRSLRGATSRLPAERALPARPAEAPKDAREATRAFLAPTTRPSLARALTAQGSTSPDPGEDLKVRLAFALDAAHLTLGQVQFAAKQTFMGRFDLDSRAIYVTADPLQIYPSGAGWVVTAVMHANGTKMRQLQRLVDAYAVEPDDFGKALSERLVAVNVDWEAVHESFGMISFEEVLPAPTTTPPKTTTPATVVSSTPTTSLQTSATVSTTVAGTTTSPSTTQATLPATSSSSSAPVVTSSFASASSSSSTMATTVATSTLGAQTTTIATTSGMADVPTTTATTPSILATSTVTAGAPTTTAAATVPIAIATSTAEALTTTATAIVATVTTTGVAGAPTTTATAIVATATATSTATTPTTTEATLASTATTTMTATATATTTTTTTTSSTTSTVAAVAPVRAGSMLRVDILLVVSASSVTVCLVLIARILFRRLRKRAKLSKAAAAAAASEGMPAWAMSAALDRLGPEVECHGPVVVGCPSENPEDAKPPNYWRHQDEATEVLARVDVAMDVRQSMQELLDSTFKSITTRDRRGGPMPSRLRIRQVQRIENSTIWQRYAQERRSIKSKRPFKCTPVAAVIGDSLRTGMTNGYALEDQSAASGNVVLPESLQRGVNEVYLWHGTSPQRALSIVKGGFKLKYSGSGAGSNMYGDGIYLAECSSKADEYAEEDPEEYPGVSCLLLCRVVLGEVLKMTTGGEATHLMIKAAMASGAYDSVLGDREVSVGTYREFVAYKEAQVYPEYLVLYSRESTSAFSTTASVETELPLPRSVGTRSSSSTGGVVLGATAESTGVVEV